MPPSLWDYTNQALERELRHIETTADSEVYVVALYVASAVDVDPRWSTLRLLWDTEMHYGQRLHGEAAELSDGRWDTTDFMRAAEPLWDHRPTRMAIGRLRAGRARTTSGSTARL